MGAKDISPRTKKLNLRNQQTRSRKREPNAYNSKIIKPPSKARLEQELRHAVTHRDNDAFEDYDDEWGLR